MPAYGNKHAIKHGLYARRFSQQEAELIGATAILDIEGEIAYQRVLINRLAQILENNGLAPESTDGLTLDTRSTVKLMNDAMGRLLALLRMQKMLKGDMGEYQAEIERGKNLARQRMGVFDYFKQPGPEPKPRRKKAAAGKGHAK